MSKSKATGIQIVTQMPGLHIGQERVEQEVEQALLLYSHVKGFICAHRGWWKSSLLLRRVLKNARKGFPTCWYAPTMKPILNAWNDLWKRSLGQELFEKSINKSDNILNIPGHGPINFYSLVDISHAAAPTAPLTVVDEAGDIPDGARESIIYPVGEKGLASYGHWEHLDVGTPNREGKPKNEFYDNLMVGVGGEYPDWLGWHIPVPGKVNEQGELEPLDSPYANPAYPYTWAKNRYDRVPIANRLKWRMEWLVEFLSEEGGQFRSIDETCTLPFIYENFEAEGFEFVALWLRGYDIDPKGFYQIGVDVGISGDWTVITVMDRNTRQQVYVHHFLPGGWPAFYAAVKRVMRLFPGMVYMDATGGNAHINTMGQMGYPVIPITFSPKLKPGMLDKCADFIERGQVALLNYAQQKFQLSKVQRKALPAGGYSIRGVGAKDDIPMALALMTYGVPYEAISIHERVDKPLSEAMQVLIGESTGLVSPFFSEEIW